MGDYLGYYNRRYEGEYYEFRLVAHIVLYGTTYSYLRLYSTRKRGREREREINIYLYIYMYMYIFIYIYI